MAGLRPTALITLFSGQIPLQWAVSTPPALSGKEPWTQTGRRGGATPPPLYGMPKRLDGQGLRHNQ